MGFMPSTKLPTVVVAPYFTRNEIVGARAPECRWSADDIRSALNARFPGDDPIAILALVESWLQDEELPIATLRQCAMLACKLTQVSGRYGSILYPRQCLENIAAELRAQES